MRKFLSRAFVVAGLAALPSVALAQSFPGGGGGSLNSGVSPISGTCTNGYVLFNNAGVLGCQAASAASLSIGGSITGSTAGYGLYVNGAALGQFAYGTGVFTALGLTLNGSGALAGTTSPAFVTPALGAATGTSLALGSAGTLSGAAANALDLVNGTSAQTFRVYNTWSSSGTNYERGIFDFQNTANVLSIGTQAAGTGVARNLEFLVGGVNKLDYGVTSAGGWTFAGTINNLTLGYGGGGISSNIAIGVNALYSNTTGGFNVIFGNYALINNTTGGNNNAIGANALHNNTTGSYNSAIGVNALQNNTTGGYNSALGAATLYDLGTVQTAGAFVVGVNYTIATIGTTDFTLIGASANTVGLTFTATGVGAGTGTATPNNTNNNTALGQNTGRGIVYGSNNTILGANVTGLAAGLTGSVILATGDGGIKADYGKTLAGAWTLTGGVSAPSVTTTALTFATLPASPAAGQRAFITDSTLAYTSANVGATAAGGGTYGAPVIRIGSTWVIGG